MNAKLEVEAEKTRRCALSCTLKSMQLAKRWVQAAIVVYCASTISIHILAVTRAWYQRVLRNRKRIGTACDMGYARCKAGKATNDLGSIAYTIAALVDV